MRGGDSASLERPVWENSALPALPGTMQGRKHDSKATHRDFDRPELFGTGGMSRLEEYYSRRAHENLRQFGYRALGGDSGSDPDDVSRNVVNNLPRGAVQEDFVVGRGDKLRIILTGQINSRKIYEVDSAGRIILDKLGIVSAAGRPISDIRKELASLAASRHNVDVFVSIESVSQIQILILGHVDRPGRKRLSAFDTLLDAFIAAGGIEKTGSLRRIKIVRRGESQIIDLYKLLLESGDLNMLDLRDGDRIVVPPIGPTIAVAGEVKRPGIYELVPDKTGSGTLENDTVSVRDILNLAGGVLARGNNRILHLTIYPDGRENTAQISRGALYKNFVQDSSLILVERQKDRREGQITLSGHTSAPGTYDIQKAPTLAKLLDSPALFGPDIYPLLGIIKRQNPDNFGQDWIPFAPYLVTQGEFDRRLQNGDSVRLFATQQIRRWLDDEKPQPYRKQKEAVTTVSFLFDEEKKARFSNIDPELYRFLKDHAISMRGAVRHPGLYPVSEGVSLRSVLSAAGGITVQADRRHVEVTSHMPVASMALGGVSDLKRTTIDLTKIQQAAILLGPGDSVRVKSGDTEIAGKSVLIKGEVRYPGRYDLAEGDTLLDLITRAGGLTHLAYPAGAVFSRASERRREQADFRAQAQELELSLARQLKQARKEDDGPDIEEVRSVQRLIARLQNAKALGRITVEADPAVLEASKEQDILLESGDRIFIPKRPLHVRVRGEVLSPSNLQFRKNKDADTYIKQAGGFTERADKQRSFVIFPDGSAQPLEIGPWVHDEVLIPPGSTIVVPLDADRLNFLERARDISQILTNLTISTVFLKDISDD